jgi:23S rRNA pseudouridine2605 synthase
MAEEFRCPPSVKLSGPAMPPNPERSGERIAKLLARAGVASRREVERMIAEGRVKLGDQPVTTPATLLPNLKGVTVDGKPVRAPEPARLFAFHKPAGLITAERDPAGRPTIYTALRNALPAGTPRLMPVGRLDFNTEGLLLLTNDGEFKRAMELPASGIPRTYRARTFGTVSQAQLEELIEGIEIDGMRYGRIDANMERSTGRNQWIEVTLTEGKNREVRRVLEHLGLEVSRLIRTAYGPFQLLDLPRGAAVEIRQVDVERFRKGLAGGTVDLDLRPKAVVRDAGPSPARRGGSPPKAAVEGPRRQAPRKPEAPSAGRSATAKSPTGKGADKPRRDRDERDRGEKLVDRPKPARKPAGWAKAKPGTRKPGARRPGTDKPASRKPGGKPGPRK